MGPTTDRGARTPAVRVIAEAGNSEMLANATTIARAIGATTAGSGTATTAETVASVRTRVKMARADVAIVTRIVATSRGIVHLVVTGIGLGDNAQPGMTVTTTVDRVDVPRDTKDVAMRGVVMMTVLETMARIEGDRVISTGGDRRTVSPGADSSIGASLPTDIEMPAGVSVRTEEIARMVGVVTTDPGIPGDVMTGGMTGVRVAVTTDGRDPLTETRGGVMVVPPREVPVGTKGETIVISSPAAVGIRVVEDHSHGTGTTIDLGTAATKSEGQGAGVATIGRVVVMVHVTAIAQLGGTSDRSRSLNQRSGSMRDPLNRASKPPNHADRTARQGRVPPPSIDRSLSHWSDRRVPSV